MITQNQKHNGAYSLRHLQRTIRREDEATNRKVNTLTQRGTHKINFVSAPLCERIDLSICGFVFPSNSPLKVSEAVGSIVFLVLCYHYVGVIVGSSTLLSLSRMRHVLVCNKYMNISGQSGA